MRVFARCAQPGGRRHHLGYGPGAPESDQTSIAPRVVLDPIHLSPLQDPLFGVPSYKPEPLARSGDIADILSHVLLWQDMSCVTWSATGNRGLPQRSRYSASRGR